MGSEGQHTQKDAGLGLSSEFTFPLQVRGQRAVDRLAELRDWSIGSIALGDTFGPNPGSFRGRSAKHKQDLLENYYRISTHLESTRKQALRLEKPDQAAVRSLLGGNGFEKLSDVSVVGLQRGNVLFVDSARIFDETGYYP